MSGGDFLGLRETNRQFECVSEIVVMPRPAADAPELKALGNFLGDISVHRFIMEDPVLTLGFREYTGREPQRDISWVQSARMGRIMVKKYDYTLEPSVTVVVNIACGNENPDTALIERCYSLARTVCEQLEEQRIMYGFITNAIAVGSVGHSPVIKDGLGQSHLMAILEILGRATYDYIEPFDVTIERAICSAEQGRSHVIITPFEYAGFNTGAKRLAVLSGGETAVISARL